MAGNPIRRPRAARIRPYRVPCLSFCIMGRPSSVAVLFLFSFSFFLFIFYFTLVSLFKFENCSDFKFCSNLKIVQIQKVF
jgi:hypothetical protein